MFSKKNQVCFADSLKVKTWWVAAAALVSEKVTVMCDFSKLFTLPEKQNL